MKRIALFSGTNLAIILILSVALRLLGVGPILDAQGSGLDLRNLWVFAGVFGIGGALIFLSVVKMDGERRDVGRALS